MNDSIDIYRCTPRTLRQFIIDCIQAGLVPFVRSSPGMGKSSIMRSIAKEFSLKLIDHRLSTSAPEDLSGLPRFTEDGRAKFSPFADLFPLEDDDIPTGYEGWMLFLDEFNSSKKEVQAAAYKLVLDRMTGQRKLHDNCVITAAGNLDTDKAIVSHLSTAMQSRLVHLEMELSHQEWMEDVALAEHWDPRLIAYLARYPSHLMDFDPNHQNSTFCCPRTWEFINRLVQGKEITDEKAPLYAGTITPGIAVDFIRFTKVAADLVNLPEILQDPERCRIPDDLSAKWSTITHLLEKIDEQNCDKLLPYVNRFPVDLRVLFFRAVVIRHPEIHGRETFRKALVNMGQYLFS